MNAFEISEMNRRIAARTRAAATLPTVPIHGPRWAGRVLDDERELVAIHGVTAATFPLDLLRDLESEEVVIVLVRRVLAAGGSRVEAERLIGEEADL